MLRYLLIGVGGALGSIARYWVTTSVASKLGVAFPYGTLCVNLASCFVIGFLITSAGGGAGKRSAWRFLVAVGFIGAFSTFSTFEWETYSAARSGAFLVAGLYTGCSLIVGLLAVWAGTKLAKVTARA